MLYIGETWKQFLRAEGVSDEGRVKGREDGVKIFLRLDDTARVTLISDLIQAWQDELDLNRAMVGGALRQGFEAEPYFGGARLGSYVSHVSHDERYGDGWTMSEFVEDWGPSMMTPEESDRLDSFSYPLTVYRGGVGSLDDVLDGVSWSLDLEIASFYANVWPKKWGDSREPVILSLTVDYDDIYAFLNDRKESEVLVPYACTLRESVRCITPICPGKAS